MPVPSSCLPDWGTRNAKPAPGSSSVWRTRRSSSSTNPTRPLKKPLSCSARLEKPPQRLHPIYFRLDQTEYPAGGNILQQPTIPGSRLVTNHVLNGRSSHPCLPDWLNMITRPTSSRIPPVRGKCWMKVCATSSTCATMSAGRMVDRSRLPISNGPGSATSLPASRNIRLACSMMSLAPVPIRLGENPDPGSVGVRALDPLTLEVRLETPVAYFIYLMAHPGRLPTASAGCRAVWTGLVEAASCPIEWCLPVGRIYANSDSGSSETRIISANSPATSMVLIYRPSHFLIQRSSSSSCRMTSMYALRSIWQECRFPSRKICSIKKEPCR